MLNINTNEMLIELTRGDTANIVFSAVDKEGNTWTPSANTDKLKFSVAKKWGAEPLMNIVNTYDPDDAEGVDKFWTITIGKDDWLAKDEDGVVILDDEGNGTDLFKFSDYVWDCQISTSTGSDTIIGKTSDLNPTFRVLGEVATE